MLSTTLLFTLLTFAQSRGVATPPDDFSAAKTLYASGAYEEALTRLSGVNDPAEADQVRALCLMALGRTSEAEKALEALVTRKPLFKMSEAEVSPRLVTMFRDVRKRILPQAIRDLYARAKASYEKKQLDAAATQFTDLMAILNDEDLAREIGTMSDMKMLTEGFLKVAQAELDAVRKAEAAKVAASQPPPVTPPPPAPPPPLVREFFTDADKDVTPPVEISRPMPEYRPLAGAAGRFEYQGVLRLVIDEKGKVADVALVQGVAPQYDAQLLAAARTWTYKPAMRNGKPVKFQKLMRVVLSPRDK
jgi:TonB family protein